MHTHFEYQTKYPYLMTALFCQLYEDHSQFLQHKQIS